MTTVSLTVLKRNGKWNVRLQDNRAIQYLGETRSRGAIEAFTARLMTDLTTEGKTPILKKLEPSPPTTRV